MAPALPPASMSLAPAATRTRRWTAPRAPSMSRKTKMALAAAPSAAPALTAPPACIPARAARRARTPRRAVPLSALSILRSAPAGYKTTTEGTMTKCKRECAKGYYSKTGVYPCKACERGYTTMERGAVECMKSDDKNKNNDNKLTIRRSVPREPSGLRTTRRRAAALCASLAGTTRTPVPGLAASAPVAQQLRLLALLSAWRTPAWTPPRIQKNANLVKLVFLRQTLEVPARVQGRRVLSHWCRSLPQLPRGIRDRWLRRYHLHQ